MLGKLLSGRQSRLVNVGVQSLLVFCVLLRNGGSLENLHWGILLWQFVHFQLIGLADFFIDDFEQKKGEWLLYILFGLFILVTIQFEVFNNVHVRVHGLVVLIGNLLGKKIDKPFWKYLAIVYLLLVGFYEYQNGDMLEAIEVTVTYLVIAVILLAVTERLSEKTRLIWIIHSLLMFVWVWVKGAYHQEAFLFLSGGISYELNKFGMRLVVKDSSEEVKSAPKTV